MVAEADDDQECDGSIGGSSGSSVTGGPVDGHHPRRPQLQALQGDLYQALLQSGGGPSGDKLSGKSR